MTKHESLLLRLTDELRALPSVDAIRYESARFLGEHLNANRVGYAEVTCDNQVQVLRHYVNGVPPVEATSRLDGYDAVLSSRLAEGCSVDREHVARDPALTAAEKAACATLQVAASVHVPLRANGVLVAFLFVHFREPRALSVDELALIEGAAERTRETIQRVHAETLLLASEARYRTLYEAIDEGFCVIELSFDDALQPRDYRFLEVNPAFERQTGLSNVIGKSVRSLIPSHEAYWYEIFGRVARSGVPSRFERRAMGLEGRWFSVSAFRVGEPKRHHVAVLFHDITPRKLAEEVLRTSEAQKALFVRLGDALRGLGDPLRIQAEATRILGQHLGVSRVLYAEVDADGNTARVHADYCCPGVLSAVGVHRLSNFGKDLPTTLSAEYTMVQPNLRDVPLLSEAEREAHASIGVAACLKVPLVKAGRLQAFLAVHHAEPRLWTSDEVAMTEDVAERTWDALERARAEAGLRASQARYRTLVDNVQDYAIFLLDAEHRVTEWTAGAEAVTGYAAHDVIGRDVSMFYPPDLVSQGELERELEEAATTGRAEREGFRVRKDGERIWVNEIATAVHDARGVLRGFTKISRNLTEQKRIELERALALEESQDARRAAERAMTMRDEFLAVVSHELRTPLSAILIWAKMLRAGAVKPEAQAQSFAVIEQSALAQRQLIEDLLDVSGMVSGKMRLDLRVSEIGPVLLDAVDAVRPMATAKNITVVTDIAEPAWCRIDPTRLQQVLWNLANNAVKFTPAGGRVSLRLAVQHDKVSIEVEDNGQGIGADFLPYVFDRFRQADASATRAHGGLGLGLAIARQLVELHGGVIGVRSEGEARGCTFTVELPRVDLEAALHPVPPSVRLHETTPSFTPAPVLQEVRALIVEDEAHTRLALQWLLEQCGATVTSVSSAAAAMDALDTEFDVLVSDVGLPDLDGYTLLAELRKLPLGATLPALALTAYAREEDRRRAEEAGFAAYLPKPVDPRELVDVLVRLVVAG